MNSRTDVFERVRKASLKSFMVFLAISALLAIASVLFGGFDAFEVKVLLTTLIIAVASICALCCSAYIHRHDNPPPGLGGVSLAGLSGGLLILGMWLEIDSEGYWKLATSLSFFALAFAHALALLSPRLRPHHVWLQKATTVNIFLLATVSSLMLLAEIDDEGFFKIIAVLAILAALETLLIPILARVARSDGDTTRETLFLAKRADGRYQDKQGRLYVVTEWQHPSAPDFPENVPAG